MKYSPVQVIARTAILLALVLGFQQLRGLSQYITGSAVNAILIIAVLSAGLVSGLAISALAALFAFFITPTPAMLIVGPIMPVVIMAGNSALALAVYLLKDKNLVAGIATGAAVKAALLWAGISLLVIPFFGQGLNDIQRTVLTAMFSYNQLITAAVGGAIARLVWIKLRKVIGLKYIQ